jgi:hypothetical protein
VILHKQQYRKIKKMLVKSDPAWVRYTDVFFTDEKTAVAEFHSMSRPGLYVFGYYYPAFHKSEKNSKILYLLEADLKKENHKQGKIPKSKKDSLFLDWKIILNENAREINYVDYKGGRYDLHRRHNYKDVLKAEQDARELNLSRKSRGKLRVVNVAPHFSYPVFPGYKNIGISTRTPTKMQELSSVNMGPFSNPQVPNLYTLWMVSKIYDEDLDSNGSYTNGYLKKIEYRAKCAYWSDKDHWKEKNTLFYYWQGKELNEIEARREIFCPLYVDFARKTKSFRKIKKLLNDGYNIQLVGYDTVSYSSAYDPDGQLLKDIFNDPSNPFSNAHVLAGMLTKNHVWE